MLYDFVWDDIEAEFEVFVLFEGRSQVEIFNVGCAKSCVGFGESGVEVAFDGCEVCGGCAFVADKIDEVPTNCEPCSMRLRFVLPDVAHQAPVRGSFMFGHKVFRDEYNGI